MWFRSRHLWWATFFIGVMVVGFGEGFWGWVARPFLSIGAGFIVAEYLTRKYPDFGAKLSIALFVLVMVYNIRFTVLPRLADAFPRTAATLDRYRSDKDVIFAHDLDPCLVEARKALAEYLVRKEDVFARNTKLELDALLERQRTGAFTERDKERQKQIIDQYRAMAKERSEFQEVIRGCDVAQTQTHEKSSPAVVAPSSTNNGDTPPKGAETPRLSSGAPLQKAETPQQKSPQAASADRVDFIKDARPANAEISQPPEPAAKAPESVTPKPPPSEARILAFDRNRRLFETQIDLMSGAQEGPYFHVSLKVTNLSNQVISYAFFGYSETSGPSSLTDQYVLVDGEGKSTTLKGVYGAQTGHPWIYGITTCLTVPPGLGASVRLQFQTYAREGRIAIVHTVIEHDDFNIGCSGTTVRFPNFSLSR